MGRARAAAGRVFDVRAAPAAILSAIRTTRVVGTRAWLAAGLAPVQPDSHVRVQGVYYVPDVPRWHDNGWAGQFVLAYMRLVRAGVVRAQRKRSVQWREVQAERHRRDANVTAAQTHDARVARWAQQRQQQQEARRGAPNARASAQPPTPPPAQPQPRGDTRSVQPGQGAGRRAAPVVAPQRAGQTQRRPDGSASCSWWLRRHDCEKCRADDAPRAQSHELDGLLDGRSGGGGAASSRSHGGGPAAAAAAAGDVATPTPTATPTPADGCDECCEINDCGPPTRTRRTDGMLCLTPRARGSMRAWFGGSGTRLEDARRARGDG